MSELAPRIYTDGARGTAHVEAFVDFTPRSVLHPLLYLCELYVCMDEYARLAWYAVHDDFGDLVKVTPGRHS